MQDITAHTYRAQDHGPDASVVLTVAEPIDGVWPLSLTRDGDIEDLTLDPYRFDEFVTLDNNSDAASAADNAVTLLDELRIEVTTIVYPDGSTVVC